MDTPCDLGIPMGGGLHQFQSNDCF